MKRNLHQVVKAAVLVGMAIPVSISFAAQDVAGAVEASVKKIDAASKVIVVDTADHVERTYHLADDLAVHTGKGADEGVSEIGMGSKVAIHYSVDGGRATVHEIDALGDDGLKAAKGSAVHVDRAAKKVSIKTADGSVQTFDLADRAAAESAHGADKAGKVTLYYTEEGEKKTVHFIGKVV
jgi:hypothetical protein